jgi:hypothetical protein
MFDLVAFSNDCGCLKFKDMEIKQVSQTKLKIKSFGCRLIGSCRTYHKRKGGASLESKSW